MVRYDLLAIGGLFLQNCKVCETVVVYVTRCNLKHSRATSAWSVLLLQGSIAFTTTAPVAAAAAAAGDVGAALLSTPADRWCENPAMHHQVSDSMPKQ